MYSNSLVDAYALIPKFDEFNKPYTIVVRSKSYEKVNLTPRQLIDQELKVHGSSLKGAREASKTVLESSSLHPIMVPKSPLIHIWFTSESMRNDTCRYFLLHRVVTVKHHEENHSIVLLTNGEQIKVAVPRSVMRRRLNEARVYFAIAFLNQFFNRPLYSRSETQIMLKCAELNGDYLID